MRRVSVAALLLLATSAAVAQQAPMAVPGTRSVAAITGGTYQADPNHTLVTWTLDHMGFSPLSGMFGQVTGTLTLDPKAPAAARVDVTIPIRPVTTTEHLNEHMVAPGKDGGKPDFFGPNPADAHFVSTAVRVSGQAAKITGNLTLNGVTRPITLDATFYGAGKAPAMMGGKENVGFHATTTIMRSQFGLGGFVPVVGDAVKLDIAAAFQK